MKQSTRHGFTLIEVMLVVSIIALLTVIVVPNILKAREMTQKTVCANSKRLIYDAIDRWALVENKGGDAEVEGNEATIAEYMKGAEMPVCPAGNTPYTFEGTVAAPVVRCNADGATGHNEEIDAS